MKKVFFSLLVLLVALVFQSNAKINIPEYKSNIQECHWEVSNIQISTGQDKNGSYISISGTVSYVCNGSVAFQFSGEIKFYYKRNGHAKVLTGEYEVIQYSGDELTEEAIGYLKSIVIRYL